MLSAIFFDLDDTIISYDGASDQAWTDVSRIFTQKYGFADAENFMESLNAVRQWYWSDPERHRRGRLDLLGARKAIIGMVLERLHSYSDEYVHEIAETYTRLQYSKIQLFPDSIGTLEEIRRLGLKTAVITNGTYEKQMDKLVRFDLLKYFDLCLIEGEVGYGKPDPRIFETALARLSLEPCEAWMVGDNLEWDVAAPQSVGIYSIWNDYRRLGLPGNSRIKPDRIVNSIAGLLELVDRQEAV